MTAISNNCMMKIQKDQGGVFDIAPHVVIRGAKLQTSFDWFRATAPFGTLSRVYDVLDQELSHPQNRKGLYFYKEGIEWSEGARIFFTRVGLRKGLCVEFPGSFLHEVGFQVGLNLMKKLMLMGMKCSRIDIAIDFKDREGYELIKQAEESCMSGELCRSKSFRLYRSYDSACHVTGETLYIGKRGSYGSGRFIRIYDKGLEQKESCKGDWVRWETEFSGDVANQVCVDVLEVHNEPIEVLMTRFAFGAVEFRVKKESTRSLKRRPFVEWYDNLISKYGVEIRIDSRPESRLDSYRDWLRTSVAPVLHRMVKQIDGDWETLWNELVGPEGFAFDLADEERFLIWDWKEYLNQYSRGEESDGYC